MRTLTHSMWAFAIAAVAALASVASAAGDAVKLSVEPPKDTTSVEAGDPGVDIQIVGIDATGARTVFGGRTVEVSATEGELVSVEAPYKFRYIPPATADKPMPVTLRAWFKQAPDVKGEAALEVQPRRPFERLVIVAQAVTLELGKSMDVEVRGVKFDGTTAAIKDLKVTVKADGAGTVEAVSGSVWRVTAPAKTELKFVGATSHLRASLDRYPKVVGDLAVVFSAEGPPAAPGGVTPPAVPPIVPPTVPPVVPPTVPPVTPPAVPPTTKTEKDGEPAGVVWPDGNVRILVWRTRNSKDDEWSKKEHDLPAPGGKLIAATRLSKLRIEILRDDVKKVELNWYIGDKKGAPIHIDDADKDGRLKLEKGKSGKTHAMLECETPEDKPAIYQLLLTTAKGEVLTEEFVLVRGKDANDDGQKDKPKKK